MTHAPPGKPATPSTTARLAAKEAPGIDPASLRKAVTALCDLARAAGHPIRREQARIHVLARFAQGTDPEAILHAARNAIGVRDETGETATRRVDQARSATPNRAA